MNLHLFSMIIGLAGLVLADSNDGPTCRVSSSDTDDAPAILAAFEECGYNEEGSRGSVIFVDDTYTISSVMNTTGLQNVDVYLNGTFSWNNSDISYWLDNSYDVGYQNQSSAWIFGGHNIHWYGYGSGTLNGNGQAWYDFIDGESNYPGRPHQITFGNITDSIIEGLNFINSQMWTMAVIHADSILLQDIYVNNTSTDSAGARNTDGFDSIYANNITLRNWVVDNGDDCVSIKANSTNILVENCVFYNGQGFALGSIGQYYGVYETIQNITARNITSHNTQYGAYVKTWTGDQVDYPPNGGGGGLGFAAGIVFEDFTLVNSANVFEIGQCTSFTDTTGDCDSSLFNLHDFTLSNWSGKVYATEAGTLQCSAASPCYDIVMDNVNITSSEDGSLLDNYECSNVEDYSGFDC